jgi:16S rRNA G966 N2-methylase RsmD
LVITTGSDPLPETQQRARDYAAKLGVTYVERGKYSVAGVSKQHGGCSVLVVLQQEIRLYQPDTDMMTFHPSMAFVRAKRYFKGVPDVMLEAAGIQAGDHVLDCTAGLGADSMMFAVGVGEQGKVIAVEASQELAALLYTGLSTYTSSVPAFNQALARIEVRHQNHLSLLKKMPDRSVDVVYFDPMFRHPVMESSSLSSLRSLANHAALSEEAVAEACRVARRNVVLKEKKGCGEFDRLGFTVQIRPHSNIVYGVIAVDQKK